MDMNSDSSSGSSHTDVMMIPYFHFTRGDYVFFEKWQANSVGATVGACIGLLLLAVFERWVAAMRGVLEHKWRTRGLAMTARPSSSSSSSEINEKSLSYQAQQEQLSQLIPGNYTRTIPPFILSHDVPRGLLHAGQSILSYLLMLAVMTFNAAFFISIIAGLGVGEMLFGRIGNGRNTH